jgi:hypothetical protein
MRGNGSVFVNLRTVFLIVAALGLASPAAAQLNQPIYPAYDGFLQNPDGSYTIAFAYFSHNAETVTVAPGASNSFSPSPGDRQQPITFKPGHWRFQCVMVVGADFDGKLRWTVAYGGVTTGTSEHMLQSNWNLVEGAADREAADGVETVEWSRDRGVRKRGRRADTGDLQRARVLRVGTLSNRRRVLGDNASLDHGEVRCRGFQPRSRLAVVGNIWSGDEVPVSGL